MKRKNNQQLTLQEIDILFDIVDEQIEELKRINSEEINLVFLTRKDYATYSLSTLKKLRNRLRKNLRDLFIRSN